MCKWQVKVKNGHFFGERKLWGSKFFAYANISWRYFILHIFEKIGANPSGKFALILTDTPVKQPPSPLTCLRGFYTAPKYGIYVKVQYVVNWNVQYVLDWNE